MTRQTLDDEEVKQYLSDLHRRFVIVPIDKAANNFAFICKTFYISKLLSEVGVIGRPNNTYTQSNLSKDDIINRNSNVCKRFGMKLTDKQRDLPLMYWTPKMHKSPIGARFIVASKNCSTKPLTEAVSKIFKLIFRQLILFMRKVFFILISTVFGLLRIPFL